MTDDEQLKKWLAGESVHMHERMVGGHKVFGGQCCPDFSCCNPKLLASREEREAFVLADERARDKFLAQFLGRMLNSRGLTFEIVDHNNDGKN